MYHWLGQIAAAIVMVLVSRPAGAHTTGASRSDFNLADASHVRAELVFARPDAERVAPGGEADWRAIATHEIDVRADGDACTGAFEGAGVVGGDGLELRATFACPHAAQRLDVSLPLLDALPPSHVHVMRLTAPGKSTEATVQSSAQHVVLDVSGGAQGRSRGVLGAIAAGALHVLLGWDHLLFLLALTLGERRVRPLVAIVTAFTVAHSVTLALAATGTLSPSARFVEPAIAASIALVAGENAVGRRVPRVVTAFGFGLVHGLGFASGLAALGLAGDRIVPALLGFNLGVECGQLGVVVAMASVLALARGRRWSTPRRERAATVTVACVGASLCVVRLAGVRV